MTEVRRHKLAVELIFRDCACNYICQLTPRHFDRQRSRLSLAVTTEQERKREREREKAHACLCVCPIFEDLHFMCASASANSSEKLPW